MSDKGLFEIARADFRIARMTLSTMQDELAINIAAYHTQQATEKLVKTVINLSGSLYPQTHNLSLLLDHAESHQIPVPSWVGDVSFMLNAWATQTRYNASFTAARRDVVMVLDKLEAWLLEVEQTITANDPSTDE